MKKVLLMMLLLGAVTMVSAQKASDMKWSDICNGKMGAEWYGSEEAMQIAEVVMYVQKVSGGWMKNDQLHKLTDAEKDALHYARHEHSCLDNGATTQEMRFLAKVWQKNPLKRYKDSFQKALDMIFVAEKGCGGWSQYYPLSGNGSYQDYITFNDDLMTNVMRLLQEIAANKGDFKDITDEASRQHCQRSFEHGLEVIIKCQVDDNGVPAAWCAQHDTLTFMPAEGRPHELPSVSGSESASLLSYLMTIEKPSEELQEVIHSAVAWLDAHKMEGKAVEDFTNEKGEADRRIVDKEGSAVWGRFIQLGGEKGLQTYNNFFAKLKKRDKKRSYTSSSGKTYNYSEYEIASHSYNPEKAYQPIFAIYDSDLQHLYYRFMYNYEDTPDTADWRGCRVPTSLNALRRTSYQFMGSWPQNVINNEYPAWKQRIEGQGGDEGFTTFELSGATYENSYSGTTYTFDNGVFIENSNGKSYATGKSNTIKYSANVTYTVELPMDMHIEKVKFYGYDNYDADAYLKSFNEATFKPTEYVFPAKSGDALTYKSYTLTPAQSIVDKFTFSLGNKQCCLIITLYQDNNASSITIPVAVGQDGTLYNLQGVETSHPTRGIYIQNGKKIVVK
jgi:pectinesterase